MTTGRCILVGFALSLATAGCAANDVLPLVFVQTTTLGITANASGSQATPEVTLGYRDVDVAIVPLNQGTARLEEGGGKSADAYSVLGQFNAAAEAGVAAKVNLGKFFATGLAARHLAQGFRDHLAKSGP